MIRIAQQKQISKEDNPRRINKSVTETAHSIKKDGFSDVDIKDI